MYVRCLKVMSSLIVVVMVSACSKTFVVVSDVPQPLVTQTNMSAKLAYSDEFRAYEYFEKNKKRGLEKVGFGEAQVSVFDRIFGSMFRLVTGDEQQADIIIEPQVLDFQYSMPSESKSTQFEIWLKYRLKITDRKNQDIADWVVKGYGKTPKTMLGSFLKSFNTAANIALRDVGAQLAIGFRNQPSIKDYLAANATSIALESPETIENPATLDKQEMPTTSKAVPETDAAGIVDGLNDAKPEDSQ